HDRLPPHARLCEGTGYVDAVASPAPPARSEAHMAKLNGSSSAEIDAPLEEVWELVEDVERAPEWQGGLMDLEALERDDGGRAARNPVVNGSKAADANDANVEGARRRSGAHARPGRGTGGQRQDHPCHVDPSPRRERLRLDRGGFERDRLAAPVRPAEPVHPLPAQERDVQSARHHRVA